MFWDFQDLRNFLDFLESIIALNGATLQTGDYWALTYESYLEDNLPHSHFYADVLARFEKINGLYRKYDDCCISFDDLMAELNTANSKEIIKLIYERLLEVSDIPHIANIENITDSDIEEIQATVYKGLQAV